MKWWKVEGGVSGQTHVEVVFEVLVLVTNDVYYQWYDVYKYTT